jgi:hypothetical protein
MSRCLAGAGILNAWRFEMVTRKPGKGHGAKDVPMQAAVPLRDAGDAGSPPPPEPSAKSSARGAASVKNYGDAGASKVAVAVEGPAIYQQIIQALHPLMEDAHERLKGYFHGSVDREDCRSGEIEHRSRPGFVPFTDGGWKVNITARGFDEGDGQGKGLGPNFQKAVASILARRDRYALTLLQDSPEWPKVLKCIGADKSYDPATLGEVQARLLDKDGAKASALLETIAGFLDEQRLNADDRVDLGIQAAVYLPGNTMGSYLTEMGGEPWAEIRVQGRIGWGEYSMPRNRAEQDEVWGPEVSVIVSQKSDSEASIAERLKKAIEMTQEWMEKGSGVTRALLLPGGGDYRIRPAGAPREGEWVFVWQSGHMKAPAFDYLASRVDAEERLAAYFDRSRGPAFRFTPQEARAFGERFAERGIVALYGQKKGHGFWLYKTTPEIARKVQAGDLDLFNKAKASGDLHSIPDPTVSTGNSFFWAARDAVADLERLEAGERPKLFHAFPTSPVPRLFPAGAGAFRMMSELGVGQPAEVKGRRCVTTGFQSDEKGFQYTVRYSDPEAGEEVVPLSSVRFLDRRVADSVFYGRPHPDFVE